MKSIYVFSNIYPKYRKGIWDRLHEDKNHNISFFFSDKTTDNIATVSIEKEYSVNNQKAFKKIDNIFLYKWLIWQKGVLSRTFDSVSVVIFLGEMTVISTWIASCILRLRGIKVLFWGHGIYGKESKIKLLLRKIFLKLADHNLVYENRAKQLMIEQGFDPTKISVVYNSNNYEQQKNLFEQLQSNSPKGIFNNNYSTLLFIGRLTHQKKIDELIQAVLLLEKKKFKFNLLIVGDGPEKSSLKDLAKKLIKDGQCIFYGATYNEKELSKLIYTSQLVISPGNIGLSAIHALSYGTPVCSHSNFDNQMPEVESIIDGENGFLFEEGNLENMANCILDWFEMNPKVSRTKIRSIVDQYYNPDYQISVIEKVLG